MKVYTDPTVVWLNTAAVNHGCSTTDSTSSRIGGPDMSTLPSAARYLWRRRRSHTVSEATPTPTMWPPPKVHAPVHEAPLGCVVRVAQRHTVGLKRGAVRSTMIKADVDAVDGVGGGVVQQQEVHEVALHPLHGCRVVELCRRHGELPPRHGLYVELDHLVGRGKHLLCITHKRSIVRWLQRRRVDTAGVQRGWGVPPQQSRCGPTPTHP